MTEKIKVITSYKTQIVQNVDDLTQI